MHYSWELKYIYIYILLNLSHFFHLKNIFSFFLFLSLRLLFFLPFSFSFFFLSPIYSLLCRSVLDLHLHHRSVLGLSSSPIFISIFIAHVVVPCHRPISPYPPSHRRSKLHCQPKLHHQSKLHQHRLHQTQERHGFRGWISWLWLDFVMAVWLGFMVAEYCGSVVVWLCLCGDFWLIWIFGNGCGWLFLAC